MCGITGWIDFSRHMADEEAVVAAMGDTLQLRGPDESAVWSDRHACFAHKRLTVVDPEGGKQPMTIEHETGTYTLCYNGELYNTEDVRKYLLLKGYSFKGHSDTEVLLTSYIEWKENVVERINGIFAFAVWDHQREELFMARDRLGVKPLFYKEQGKGMLFASEIKAILAHPEISAELDREGLCELFGLGPSHSPGSGVFRGINELRPAHAMRLSRTGMKIWRYWDVKSGEHTDSLEQTTEKVRYLVEDAIVRQLVSDVPLCTFLSGGIDSSVITAIASRHYKKENLPALHTYSIDYQDNELYFQDNHFQPSNDAPWIEMVSKAHDTEHHRCVISQEMLVEGLEQAMAAKDLPGMADIDSSLLWFCERVKERFTVSLSGECADEIFGGYPWFHDPSTKSEGFPWIRSTSERSLFLKDQWRERLKVEEYVAEKYRQTMKETPLLTGENAEESRRRQLFYSNLHYFMINLLERKDRMSMAASLEVRVPFADHTLVEYVWNIPWEMKMTGNCEKGILRKAMEGILPEEILYRKKSPYPKTHHPIYRDKVTSLLQDRVSKKSSVLHEFFKKEQLQQLIESKGSSFQVPWYGQLMSGPQLLAHLAQLDMWFERYNVNVIEAI
ncbi:asparagine synthase (glutamine-hydrolyzing) [Bacillus testis]|uniref:asparagine synthase (glutamine-hydrolyzing) n=1 Tax=Bacillus testis TaxID=1622072 RepID=UPI00067E89DD|nr:asparagine synthase (glutamine-hydrolyzing) [Bacillus testis]